MRSGFYHEGRHGEYGSGDGDTPRNTTFATSLAPGCGTHWRNCPGTSATDHLIAYQAQLVSHCAPYSWKRLKELGDGHGTESDSVSEGLQSGALHGRIWERGEVHGGAVSLALAERIRLPQMLAQRALSRSKPRPVPVQRLSIPSLADRGDDSGEHEIAASHLVPGDVPDDADEERDFGVGAVAATFGELQHRLEGQAQADAGDEGAWRHAPFGRLGAAR